MKATIVGGHGNVRQIFIFKCIAFSLLTLGFAPSRPSSLPQEHSHIHNPYYGPRK
jgi:hypothetical protein